MNYEIVEMEERTFAGVSAVTKNDSPDMQSVIGGLWQKLYSGVAQSMKNRVNGKSVGLYCDYAQDMSYTVLAGCQISSEGVAEAEKNGLTVKKNSCRKIRKIYCKRRNSKISCRKLGSNLEHSAGTHFYRRL